MRNRTMTDDAQINLAPQGKKGKAPKKKNQASMNHY